MRISCWLGLALAAGLSCSGPALAQKPAHPEPRAQAPRTAQRPVARTPAHPRQRGSAPGVGGGFIPAAPPKRPANAPSERPNGKPHIPGHPVAPHVDIKGNVWVGRERPNSPRYHLARPWAYGHFPGTIGTHQIWHLEGGGPGRFFFDGDAFLVAQPDWGYCSGWQWNNDYIVLYADPDQPGWYIAYNVRLGTWVHVEFLGPA
ncbi:MAG: hypothetical protein ACRD04_07780 [Terriglobales bacterium]